MTTRRHRVEVRCGARCRRRRQLFERALRHMRQLRWFGVDPFTHGVRAGPKEARQKRAGVSSRRHVKVVPRQRQMEPTHVVAAPGRIETKVGFGAAHRTMSHVCGSLHSKA